MEFLYSMIVNSTLSRIFGDDKPALVPASTGLEEAERFFSGKRALAEEALAAEEEIGSALSSLHRQLDRVGS